MKQLFTTVFTLIFTAFLAGSCSNIDELSDYNELLEFTVLDHSPSTIDIINNAEIEGSNIYIPILYGKYEFPMRFRAAIKIPSNADQVVGVDFSQELELKDINDKIRFYVMAQSGLSQAYYIQARAVDLDEDIYIRSNVTFEGLPADVLMLDQAVTRGDTVSMFAVGQSYPITVKPVFTISDASVFENFTNGETALKFSNASTFHKLKVVSKSGKSKVWNIKLINAPLLSGETETDEVKLESTNIKPRTFTAKFVNTPDTYSIADILVSNKTEEITISAARTDGAVEFPRDVHIKMDEPLEGVVMVDMHADTVITFDSADDLHTFYIVDTETAVARKWEIKLQEWKSNMAKVTAASYTGVSFGKTSIFNGKNCAEIDGTEIYNDTREVYIKMTTYREVGGIGLTSWYIQLTPQITVSEGATVSGVGQVKFESPSDTKGFTVIAPDGTEHSWTLKIKDATTNDKSDQCDLLGFSLLNYRPNYIKLNDETPVSIDKNTHTVTVNILDDTDSYPFSFDARIPSSPFSTVSARPERFTFNTPKDVQNFTITAENGTTSQEWTVKLNTPPKGAFADVTSFAIREVTPSGFDIYNYDLNTADGTIKLHVGSLGSYPMNVAYTIAISLKANAEIPLRGTFSFGSINDVQKFTITAEDGTEKEWTVSLIYKYQFPNWNLNEWGSDNRTPSFFATANNDQVKGTSKTVGSSGEAGDYAAMLKTTSILGKIASGSIFVGEFKYNLSGGLNDPISLTWFGIPYSTTSKLLGVNFDIAYSLPSGKAGQDMASARIELINYNDPSKPYEYHGTRPGETNPHPDNSAVYAAGGKMLFSTVPTAGAETVPDGQWVNKTLYIDYNAAPVPLVYTHMMVVFASSHEGDAFKGVDGATLKVDNIKLIYED